MQVIVFEENGVWKTVFPAPGKDPESFVDDVVPAGCVWQIANHPGGDVVFDGADFAPRPITAEQVKAEAGRRIIAIVPEWKQRNLTAQAAQLAEKGRVNWTAEELAAWNGGLAIWAQVKAVRDASDVIEAMDPIPTDYTDDSYWPAAQ